MATTAGTERVSNHVGTVGETLETQVWVNHIQSVPNKFNRPRFLYFFGDSDGNTLKSFGTLRVLKGDRITIRGKVRAHDVYNGKKSTELAEVEVVG